jgi:molybdenum cofactor cytidylyltransferase
MQAEVGEAECVIPAAGRSSRMETWKPALRFGNSTMVEHVVDTARAVCRRVIVVAGYRGNELRQLLGDRDAVTVVTNGRWELGMFSSIRTGVAHLDTGRFFICLADLPLVRRELFEALLRLEAEVVVPVHLGRRGHPVLLGPAVAGRILETDPATGIMREIIREFPVHELPWYDDTILRDVDTPEDFRRMREIADVEGEP